ncbi:hypothetical protein HHK36_021283 [Tetracentron sinense]|uniref:Uncharacterized protein n=1 Tax=Tetracentron sinense TaxID=13715 RepID=A0A834YR82_TETSI|nr:hypothetical protein HHK36_021283 [Tetracentron sinense]
MACKLQLRCNRASDKTVRLWDVQSGECVRIFIGHRSMILSLAMSPDGRYMASGDEDGTIMVWDLSSGRCVIPLMRHTSCVWTLAFSCEGSLLASGSANCTVKLWDVIASTKAPRTEENKGGSTNRFRLLKALRSTKQVISGLLFAVRTFLGGESESNDEPLEVDVDEPELGKASLGVGVTLDIVSGSSDILGT